MTTVRTNWKPKIEEGERAEYELLSHIQVIYKQAYKKQGNFKEYDIFVSGDHSIEVKNDIKSDSTGNFAIEYMCDGKPSVILTTKANWWVFADSLKFYFFETKRLFDWLLSNKNCYKKTKAGDIDKEAMCLLVPKKILTNTSMSTPFLRDDFNYGVLQTILKNKPRY